MEKIKNEIELRLNGKIKNAVSFGYMERLKRGVTRL